jgi:hypothetical protein
VQNEVEKLEKRLEGKIPVGFFDIDLARLIGYNRYEGLKPGFGLETNNNLSHYFSVGGYFSYGTRDKNIRHGEWINIFPAGNDKVRIFLSFKDQNKEIGAHTPLGKPGVRNDDFFRNFLIRDMYITHRYSGGIDIKPSTKLNTTISYNYSKNKLRDQPERTEYYLSQASLQLRYIPDPEKNINKQQTPNKKTIWQLSLYQGIPLGKSGYDYTKTELSGKFNIYSSPKTNISSKLQTGKVWGDIPAPELFNGHGSYSAPFTILSKYSFATMRMNEFLSSMFAAIYTRITLSNLLSPKESLLSPDIVIAHNMGVGTLENNYNASPNFEITSYREGFFESGLELNNLIPYSVVNYGLGVYYRYGPYGFDDTIENFAFKLGVLFNF